MTAITPTEARRLMHEYVAAESLRKHMEGVAICMRAYADQWGEDADLYEVVALLHDHDYERHPDEHPVYGVERLRERGVDDTICRAILSHVDRTGVRPESRLERTLRACDETSGFIVACALVRPQRLEGLKPSSVKKKMKTKAFAAAVDRDEIVHGAELLGVELDEHLAFCIEALRAWADTLGLTPTEESA